MSASPPLPDLDAERLTGRGRPPLGARAVRQPALPDLLVAEAVVRARPHGLRARARHGRDRARHAPLLPGDVRDARAAGRAIRAQLHRPEIPTIAEQHRAEGPNLWERDPDRCCHIRKVEPLRKALEPYEAWISGIRRDQSPSRAGDAEDGVVRALRRLEGAPARRLGREARLGLHLGQRDPLQPAARRRATRRSAAFRVRGRSRPTRRSAPVAGPAPTSWSAGFTWTMRNGIERNA